MPVNKKALQRYRIIDDLLKSRSYPTFREIWETIEDELNIKIGRSTLEKDLKDMREDPELGYFAPIKHHKPSNGYHYTDRKYTIKNFTFLNEELEALSLAASLLTQNEFLKGYGESLANAIRITEGKKTDHNFIQLENQPGVQGTEWLGPLADAIRHKKVLSILYQPFRKEPEEFTIHPFLLKEYHNRWYVIGYNEEAREPYTLGLDRIHDIAHRKNRFYRITNDCNPETLYQFSFGITTNTLEPEDYVLKFTGPACDHIKARPLHVTQEILEETEDHLVIKLILIPSLEFRKEVLGWGDQVEVLEPEEFRKEIGEIIRRSNEMYS